MRSLPWRLPRACRLQSLARAAHQPSSALEDPHGHKKGSGLAFLPALSPAQPPGDDRLVWRPDPDSVPNLQSSGAPVAPCKESVKPRSEGVRRNRLAVQRLEARPDIEVHRKPLESSRRRDRCGTLGGSTAHLARFGGPGARRSAISTGSAGKHQERTWFNGS